MPDPIRPPGPIQTPTPTPNPPAPTGNWWEDWWNQHKPGGPAQPATPATPGVPKPASVSPYNDPDIAAVQREIDTLGAGLQVRGTIVPEIKFDTRGRAGPTGRFYINVQDPNTRQIKQVTLNRARNDGQNPKSAVVPSGDPEDTTTDWGNDWLLAELPKDIVDDKAAKGYNETRQIGDTLYGTNQQTGNFEPVAGAPKFPDPKKALTNITQIPDGQGNLQAWGLDENNQPVKIPGFVTPDEKPHAGAERPNVLNGYRVQEIFQGNGWVIKPGTEPIPWTPEAKASALKAQQQNVADGTEGPAQVVNGMLRHTVRRNGEWVLDTSKPEVPYSLEAQQTQKNIQAQEAAHPEGSEYQTLINGNWVWVKQVGNKPEPIAGRPIAPAIPEKPQVITTVADNEWIAQQMPDGSIKQVKNPNYQPKDPALQQAMLKQLADQKQTEIRARVNAGELDEPGAAKEFGSWWDQNVAPRQAAIETARQQQDFENRIKAQNANASAFTSAQQGGQNVIDTWNATKGNIVGPGYADAMQSVLDRMTKNAKMAPIDAKGLVYEMPDIQAQQQAATTAALQQIGPAAPPTALPPGANFESGLDRTRYMGAFGQGGGPAPGQDAAAAAQAAGAAPQAQMLAWNNGQPSPGGMPLIAGATPFMNAGTTYYGNGGLQPDQPVAPAPVAAAPVNAMPPPADLEDSPFLAQAQAAAAAPTSTLSIGSPFGAPAGVGTPIDYSRYFPKYAYPG